MNHDIRSRKADHLDLCIDEKVGFRNKTTLFEEVELVHNALPELALSEIDLSVEFAGKTLRAPLIIAAMTGGLERADLINRDLALVAEEEGIGFAFGSQRALLVKGIRAGYQVRDVAPTALVLGNIGVVQAKESQTSDLINMLNESGCDALCIHLNPAMELVQPEGDVDFRDGLLTIERLVNELDRPVIVKETGCGLSKSVGQKLKEVGVQYVDTSGAGGTSWVGVETHRANNQQERTGNAFWDWGIPTAASVLQLKGLQLSICATGGMRNGLMIAKAISLGATCGGIARPYLQAHASGGIDALRKAVKQTIHEIRVACLLCGVKKPTELAQKPIVIGQRLQRWAQ